jgi:hypothetical protein
MELIFVSAASVSIWLGDSDEMVERGLATLVEQTNSYDVHRETGAALSPAHFLSSTLSLDEEIRHIKQFFAINALPYWRRGWTFQENMHSQKHICYGSLMIELRSWHRILRAYCVYRMRMRRKLRSTASYHSIHSLLSDSEKQFLSDPKQLTATLAPFAFAE